MHNVSVHFQTAKSGGSTILSFALTFISLSFLTGVHFVVGETAQTTNINFIDFTSRINIQVVWNYYAESLTTVKKNMCELFPTKNTSE